MSRRYCVCNFLSFRIIMIYLPCPQCQRSSAENRRAREPGRTRMRATTTTAPSLETGAGSQTSSITSQWAPPSNLSAPSAACDVRSARRPRAATRSRGLRRHTPRVSATLGDQGARRRSATLCGRPTSDRAARRLPLGRTGSGSPRLRFNDEEATAGFGRESAQTRTGEARDAVPTVARLGRVAVTPYRPSPAPAGRSTPASAQSRTGNSGSCPLEEVGRRWQAPTIGQNAQGRGGLAYARHPPAITHVGVIRPASGIRPHASRRHPSDLALQRGREHASCPRNGRWDAKLSPPLSPCRCTAAEKIVICRDEEGERRTRTLAGRDHNPHQRVRLSCIRRFRAIRVALSCPDFRSQLSPRLSPSVRSCRRGRPATATDFTATGLSTASGPGGWVRTAGAWVGACGGEVRLRWPAGAGAPPGTSGRAERRAPRSRSRAGS